MNCLNCKSEKLSLRKRTIQNNFYKINSETGEVIDNEIEGHQFISYDVRCDNCHSHFIANMILDNSKVVEIIKLIKENKNDTNV